MSEHDGGKGDVPRPLGVTMEEFDKNFDRIFGNKTQNNLSITINAEQGEAEVTINKTWEIE